jgi:DNA-directed RNA polymerase subunit alpha
MDKTYKSLTIPKLLWEANSLTNAYGELVAQPLEPGFGITIGNALRRILLGGVEGTAVTSFIIKGVNNEFAAVPGMVEDAMQIALNIKEIVIKSSTGLPGKMHLKKSGAGIATVADIIADEHLELVNKDHIIGHIALDGECDIQFFVENGRGYQQAQWPQDKAYQEDNRIYVDAMFSPIEKVMVDIEKVRVGQAIDYDKLTLRISTNGSINPLDALHYAVSVLRTQLEHFLTAAEIPFNSIAHAKVEVTETEKSQGQSRSTNLQDLPLELFLKPIEDLELSVRAQNCLINAGITRIIDLVNLSEEGLLGIKNFGRKSLTEVKDAVRVGGLQFGMNIKEEDVLKALEKQAESN